MLRKFAAGFLKRTLKALAYGLTGGFIVLLAVFVWYLDSRPNLSVWHLAELARILHEMP